jgi:acetone carboxylase gamma subunit
MFCPKCNYLLDITKEPINNEDKDMNVLNVNQFLNIVLDDNEVDVNYKLNFNINELTNNSKFKKLDEETKNMIYIQYENLNQGKNNYVHFICNNCGYYKDIVAGTQLYNKSYVIMDTSSLENPMLKVNDPTLLRTRDYICKNKNCSTHKDKSNAEATFFRTKNSFQLTYVCCVCKHSWLMN